MELTEKKGFEIKRHDFEKAKNELKIFSESLEESNVNFDKVNDSKSGFKRVTDIVFKGDWSKSPKVTGADFNNLVEQIQSYLVGLNSNQMEVVNQFKEVYKALDSLDKDYITAIVKNMEKIEKTSEGVKEANDGLKRTVDGLESAVKNLVNLDGKIDDAVTYLKIVENRGKENTEKISQVVEKLNEYENQIIFLTKTCEILKEQEKDIANLKEFNQNLASAEHLGDIDSMWDDVNSQSSRLDGTDEEIRGLVQSQQYIQKCNENSENALMKMKDEMAAVADKFSRRIKCAYYIAGGSAGIAVIDLILHLLRVI